jgi:TPR repeat protein
MPGTCRGVATSLLLFALLCPIEGIAGTYEDGDSAFQRKDYTTAMQHWKPIAAAGHAGAQLGVATLYYGGLGVVQDYGQAFAWCTKSADQGDAKAKYVLGAMYRDGKGVDKNLSLAMALFREAAEHDVHGAQYSLGMMYLLGEGVPPNYAEACYWLSLAAGADDKDNSQLRASASYLRDEAASKLSAEQVAQITQRVSERKLAQSPPGK